MANDHLIRTKAVRDAYLSGAATKLIAILVSFVSIGITVRSIGEGPWGLLAALTGAISLLGFLDFGVGNALIARLAQAFARDDRRAVSQAIGESTGFLFFVAAILVALSVLLFLFLPDRFLLVGNGVSHSESRLCMLLLGLSIALAAPASLGSRIALGRQAGLENNVVTFAAIILSFILVILGVWLSASVVFFVAVTLYVPVFTNAAQTARYLIGGDRIHIRPHDWNWSTLRAQIVAGLPFTLLVLAGALSYQTDTLVVSYINGLTAAAAYGIVLKIFTSLSSLLSGGLQQMWSSTAHAISSGDFQWVRSAFIRTLVITAGAYTAASLVILIFGEWIVGVWSGGLIRVDFALLFWFALWSIYSFLMSQLSSLLNGAGKIWPQAWLALAMAGVNLPLSIYLAGAVGLVGPLIASLLTHILIVGAPTAVMVRRLLQR